MQPFDRNFWTPCARDSELEPGNLLFVCECVLALLITHCYVARWRGIRYVKIFLYKFQMSKEGFRVYNKLTVVPISSTFSVFAGISQQS